MDGLVFFKGGKSYRVSDETPLPVDIAGGVTVNVDNLSVDHTPVINKLNELKQILELLETDIDSGVTATAPDLKTRVSQVKSAVDDLRTALLAELNDILGVLSTISGDINETNAAGDLFGRLDNTISGISNVNTNLASVLTRLNEISLKLINPSDPNDLYDQIGTLHTLVNNVLARLEQVQRRVEDGSIAARYLPYFIKSFQITNTTITFSSGSLIYKYVLQPAGTALNLTTNTFGENVNVFTPYRSLNMVNITVFPDSSSSGPFPGVFVRVFGALNSGTIPSTPDWNPSTQSFGDPVLDRRLVYVGSFPGEGVYSPRLTAVVPLNYPFEGFRIEVVRENTTFGNYVFRITGNVR